MSKRKTESDAPPTINVHRLQLQFDSDRLTSGDADQQAEQAVNLINEVLQHQLSELGAQLIAYRDEIEAEEAEFTDSPAIDVFGVQLQFDADRVTHGTAGRQADQAIDLVNGVLEREPADLGARLISYPDEIEVEGPGEGED